MFSTNNAVIYEKLHRVCVNNGTLSNGTREIQVRITKSPNNNDMTIKLRELDNFTFYFSRKIDYISFNQLKQEQSLEINFEELSAQLIDLLHETDQQKIFLRLEADSKHCKMVFFEKAKLKSLIFLTIDMDVISKTEIINEMNENLMRLNDTNKHLVFQVNSLNNLAEDRKQQLQECLKQNGTLSEECFRALASVESVVAQALETISNTVNLKLKALSIRNKKLLDKLELLRIIVASKSRLCVDAEQNANALKRENDGFRNELHHMRLVKSKLEEDNTGLREKQRQQESQLAECNERIAELRNDNQEAALLIAQKSKTHDEIAKDLVQANSMLVNFNNLYQSVAKDLEAKKEEINRKEQTINEQNGRLRQLQADFDEYRKVYNADQVKTLQSDLMNVQKSVQELDKENKEVHKLNALLTRKLSTYDNSSIKSSLNAPIFSARSAATLPPSQRTNY